MALVMKAHCGACDEGAMPMGALRGTCDEGAMPMGALRGTCDGGAFGWNKRGVCCEKARALASCKQE